MRMLTTLLGLVCLSGLARAADPAAEPPIQPLVFQMEMLQVSDEGFTQLNDQARLPDGFRSHARVLQSQELMGSAGHDCLFFLGHKSPIVYFDARNSQFQVQYVDTGIKLNIKCSHGQDGYDIELYPEMSVLESNKVVGTAPATVSYPQTTVLQTQTHLTHVHPGDSIVVGRSRGTAARRLLEAVGPNLGENVVTVLTVRQL